MTTYRVTGGPWPERIGLLARIVDPPSDKPTYPWHGKSKSEVVVYIENDPLASKRWRKGWTCVMPRNALSPIDGSRA